MKKILSLLFIVFALGACSLNDEKPLEPAPTPEPAVLIDNLFDAVLKSSDDSVQKAIDDGADLTAYDSGGYTALMRAVQNDDTIIVDILINGGSKIYQPYKNDLNVTAWSQSKGAKAEIGRLFTEENKKLFVNLEGFINENKFDEALSFSKDNHLPKEELLPDSDIKALALVSQKATEISGADYVLHLISDMASVELSKNKELLLLTTSKIKNLDLYKSVLKTYNENELGSELSKITEVDAESIDWMTGKIKQITAFDLALDINEVNQHLLSFDQSLSPNNDSKTKYLDLVSAVLQASVPSTERNSFMKVALTSIAQKSTVDSSYLDWISDAVDMWASSGLPATSYPFDDIAYIVLQAVEGKSFNIDRIETALGSVYQFAPAIENKSEQSIKLVISGNFKSSQRNELLEILLNKTKVLPEGIISYAIEAGGIESLQLILDSNVNFNPNEQSEAILTALTSTRSGVVAYQLLVELKERGLPFGSESGAKAVTYTFNKVVKDKDDTYSAPLNFLLSISPSPLSSLGKTESLNMLKELLASTRLFENGWPILSQILDKLNTSEFDGSEKYKRTLNIPDVDEDQEVFVSFTWDFALSAFEFYRNNPSDADAIFIIFKKVLEKFPKDSFAMGYVNELSETNPQLFLTQNILPLGLLLAIGSNNIDIRVTSGNKSSNYKATPKYLQLYSLSNSKFYEHYSSERTFWEKINRHVIDAGNSFSLPRDRSAIEFMSVVLNSYVLNTYPNLSKRLENLKIDLIDSEKRCVLMEDPTFGIGNGMVGPDGLLQPSTNTIDPTGTWTTLGNFEILRPIKNKCLDGEALTRKEISFVSDYIQNNAGFTANSIQGSLVTTRTKGLCREVPSPHTIRYQPKYDFLGVPFLRDLSADIEAGNSALEAIASPVGYLQECFQFSYNANAVAEAKRQFLNSWFSCASSNNDQALINFFQSVSARYGISPTNPASSKVNLCHFR